MDRLGRERRDGLTRKELARANLDKLLTRRVLFPWSKADQSSSTSHLVALYHRLAIAQYLVSCNLVKEVRLRTM